MDYSTFFSTAMGFGPYPYQQVLAEGPWPDRLKIPTGLGKTGAVALAWAFKHYKKAPDAHMRVPDLLGTFLHSVGRRRLVISLLLKTEQNWHVACQLVV